MSRLQYIAKLKLFLIINKEGEYQYYFGIFTREEIENISHLFRDKLYTRVVPYMRKDIVINGFEDKYKEYKAKGDSLFNDKQPMLLSSISLKEQIETIESIIEENCI